jgi:L-threonylcarbamoyladenylate synthase
MQMKTNLIVASEPNAIQRALELLRAGEVVAIPTDTVYGLATDGFNASAVEKLYVVKDRPSHKAIMLLLGDYEDLEKAATYISPNAQRLAAAFWPGGLTLVVPAREELPAILRADAKTIGVRLPDSDLVRDLVKELGRPLAATSANLSGGANPRTAQDVLRDLGGRLPLILDGGETRAAVPSTVVDCTVEPPRILREGAIAREEIERVLNGQTTS